MVLERNYNTMCAEVLEILKHCPESDVNKIPKKLIDSLKLNKELNTNVIINPAKGIFEQDVSTETIIMMFIIFRNYWATGEEKKEIDDILIENEIKYEELYSVENLLKKNTINTQKEVNNEEAGKITKETEVTSLIEYHETIIAKLVKLIKNFFKR